MQITLDKPRTLRFNVNTLAWLEQELCEPGQEAAFLATFMVQAKFPGFRILRALLWACLRHEDKNLTVEQVGDLMASARTAEIYEKCLTVMNEFFAEGSPRPLSEGSADSSGGVSAATTSGSVN